MDLGRQLTRRDEDESSRESGRAADAARDEAFDHGQPEGGCFASTGLSARE
jgi:hypothetical protein